MTDAGSSGRTGPTRPDTDDPEGAPPPPDPGTGQGSPFGPDSPLHRFFNDPRWALAMVRATVLEAAHPQIGAALIDNSTFVAHPWRRLRNTLVSLQRMFGADDRVRQKEAARLNRLHSRLRGTDARSRPYDAMDPDVRAWVVATLFESSVTMCRLSGQPLDPTAMEELYAGYQAYLAALGDLPGHLPPTLQEFWPYFDRVVEEELENTEAMRVILYKLFDHLPAPPLLSGLPTVWAAGRALAGPVIGTITVASLPEPFRRRVGLPEVPGARTLMHSAYMAVGLARFLPEGGLGTETLADLLYLSPDSDDPRAAALSALRDRVKQAGALLRLVTPFPERDPAPGAGPYRDAAEFFAAVLDQTGDGHLDWPDLAAMARELSTRLDLDEPAETRLYDAFAQWWRELQSALDTDGDGRVSQEEYAAAVPSLAGPALIRVAEVLFDVTDADGNQVIDAQEYRALFRTGFRRTVTGADPSYSRSAFVKDFLAFMSGRRRSTPYDPLLAQA
ncbi:oxygenase MpaB family protein [Streptomyces sp. HPF1205]|uniref:oxygenase MpaB family protein n=1 Tax=Streptomyces sp. HPF1205 TaxID=2873262 RepID=UPI001CEC7B93|nr:oxygenase MpaB family protein [Streptomyces sp. HPF1205]